PGGPQKVPIIRDILLLPWVLMLSRRVILHFHAAGIADWLEKNSSSLLSRIVESLYRKAFAAIVLTNFGRRDPETLGIKRIIVVPCRIDDNFDPQLLDRGDHERMRLLYVGHLCPDKGTPDLLRAFAAVHRKCPELELNLVGECLPPFTEVDLTKLIENLRITPHVRRLGV